jgi:hypothetical protein
VDGFLVEVSLGEAAGFNDRFHGFSGGVGG